MTRDVMRLLAVLVALSLAASWGMTCGALQVARESVRGRR